MVELRTARRTAGFSLVEMLVALVFTMVLMAGMASVFKASLSTFYTAGESTSSMRRSRMSIDMLGEDLNTADMYMVNLTGPPTIDPAHPPFYVLPNMPIAGDPNLKTADQIYFTLDAPLQFEGSITTGGTQASASQLLASGPSGTVAVNNASTFNGIKIECNSTTYANQVANSQTIIFKDTFECGKIVSAVPNGTAVYVVMGTDPLAAVTGIGASGNPLHATHMKDTKVVFTQQNQVIRYQLQYLSLDPNNTIPCLVRDQGTWVGNVFTPNTAQQIITENVQNFKVYLSVNSGQTWAGWNKAYQDMTAGWTNGLLTELTGQLNAVVLNGFTAITGNPSWFRSIPTLIRIDLTTRSATQRTEYSSTPNTSAYKLLTQSLIFMPRHSGLPMDAN